MSRRLQIVCLPLCLLVGGCAAKTAFDIATAPVRAAANTGGKAVDLMTTSTDEADRNRGREMRKAEERMVRLRKRYDRLSDDCAAGDDDACEDRHEVWNEMLALRAPARPD